MPDDLSLHAPEEIVRLYDAGFIGSYCDPEDTERLLSSLPLPLFGDLLAGDGAGKISLPFKAVVAFEKAAGRVPYDEVQLTGDCVSHGTRNAADIARANDPDIRTTEDWIDRTATEPLYGARGHSGQGASCARIVGWAHQRGGLMLRKAYPDLGLDLTTYNPKVGIGWGGTGVPDAVTTEAAKHRIGTISLITTWEQARDAIANGYGVVCCSGQGFGKVRNHEGVAEASGSWAHAMAWTAADDTRPGDCRFCVQNSWGFTYLSGPLHLGQPEGSFWIRQSVAQNMIAAGGTYAVSNVNGFPRRTITDWANKEILG